LRSHLLIPPSFDPTDRTTRFFRSLQAEKGGDRQRPPLFLHCAGPLDFIAIVYTFADHYRQDDVFTCP